MSITLGPTFLGIGAQKAGTTWLYKMLRLHPDIGMPVQKELHFWDDTILNVATIEHYMSLFGAMSQKVRGEITPSYAILPVDRIALIKYHLPELRLIYILRNPIDRAWSHAKMELAKYVYKKKAQPPEPLSEWFEAHFRSRESLLRGDYAATLENWLSHYPMKNIKTYIYEEDLQAPKKLLESCCLHIGADPDFYGTGQEAIFNTRIYPETTFLGRQPSDLPNELPTVYLDSLISIYKQPIAKISALTGRDLYSLWLSPYEK
ncbi:MAG: sulfotransferase [Gammaproteobacteria bacterium]